MTMTNGQIADVFDQVADLLEFQGENPFRLRAYRNAAVTLPILTESVASIAKDPERKLTDLPGVGKDLADKITTLVTTGELPLLAELTAKTPPSGMAVPHAWAGAEEGRGAVQQSENRHARTVAQRLAKRIASANLKGFGEKTEQKILEGLAIAATSQDRIYSATADEFVQSLLARPSRMQSGRRGRRGRQLSAASGNHRRPGPARGVEQAERGDGPFRQVRGSDRNDRPRRYQDVGPPVGRTASRLHSRAGQIFGAGIAILYRLKGEQRHPSRPSKGQGFEDQRIWRLSRRGIDRGPDRERGLARRWPCPVTARAARRARREFEWADEGKLPELVTLEDIRGDLHMHTDGDRRQGNARGNDRRGQARGLRLHRDHRPLEAACRWPTASTARG